MDGTKIFVGSLPSDIDDVIFLQVFEQYGTVVSSMCNMEKKYGFVSYSTPEESQEAIKAMNGFVLLDSTLTVKLADNQPGSGGHAGSGIAGERLYIKGLPPGMTEDAIVAVFEPYGSVQDAKVLVSSGVSTSGAGQTVAIIRMETLDEAAWIVDNLHGNIPVNLTDPIEVSYAGHKLTGGSKPSVSPPWRVAGGTASVRSSPYGKGASRVGDSVMQRKAGTATLDDIKGAQAAKAEVLVPSVLAPLSKCGAGSKLYIKNLPSFADDVYLYKVFAPLGRVMTAKALVKDNYVIGFVQYASDAEAQGAIVAVNGKPLNDGSVLHVSVKTSKNS